MSAGTASAGRRRIAHIAAEAGAVLHLHAAEQPADAAIAG